MHYGNGLCQAAPPTSAQKEMVRINKVSGNEVLYLQFLCFLEPHQLGIPDIVLTLRAACADSLTGGSPGL